jgi:hypothetical protein
MSYRTDPCPHCGVVPDETDDPMGALETCLREAVQRAAAEALLRHRIGLIKYRPGAVFWYRPAARWCRVIATESLPFGVADSADWIPIEYPADDPAHGMIPILSHPEELHAWDPSDPRLPEPGFLP